jgi:hypothetical protein
MFTEIHEVRMFASELANVQGGLCSGKRFVFVLGSGGVACVARVQGDGLLAP